MSGQITPDTPFGKALIRVAKHNPHLKIWVDDGAWMGGGSTLCLVHATHGRDVKIIAVEANPKIFEVCKTFWSTGPPSLEVKWGRIGKKMMTEEQVRAHPKFFAIRQHFDLYWKTDVEDFEAAPLVDLPRYVDAFVLDAGEFGGEGSLERALSHKPRVIAMDDIFTMKHDKSYQRLIKSGEWGIVEKGDDRNGWVILERRTTDAWTQYIEAGLGC